MRHAHQTNHSAPGRLARAAAAAAAIGSVRRLWCREPSPALHARTYATLVDRRRRCHRSGTVDVALRARRIHSLAHYAERVSFSFLFYLVLLLSSSDACPAPLVARFTYAELFLLSRPLCLGGPYDIVSAVRRERTQEENSSCFRLKDYAFADSPLQANVSEGGLRPSFLTVHWRRRHRIRVRLIRSRSTFSRECQ